MADTHKPAPEQPPPATRSTVFTVKDAERAVYNFLALTVVYILAVFAYEIDTAWHGFLAVGWILFIHSPQFLATATILIISREGGDIMLFRRWTEARRQHAAAVAKAKDEGRSQGLNQGRDEGFNQGRNEGRDEGRNEMQQQWTAWNTRRLAAAAKGEPFNEPPPQ